MRRKSQICKRLLSLLLTRSFLLLPSIRGSHKGYLSSIQRVLQFCSSPISFEYIDLVPVQIESLRFLKWGRRGTDGKTTGCSEFSGSSGPMD